MELDQSAKVATIASLAVGMLVSLTTWFTNLRIQRSQDELAALLQKEKQVNLQRGEMELRKTEMAEGSRLIAGFSLPMARSFALQYKAWMDDKRGAHMHFVVPEALSAEMATMWPSWANRNGLMTGRPCEPEGLLARQIVLLDLQNEGRGDAVEVSLTVQVKRSPQPSPSSAWHVAGAQGSVAYSELGRMREGWESVEMPLPDLPGQTATDATRRGYRVVLASVSGRSALYGTVMVPVSLHWRDRMTGQLRQDPVLEHNASLLNAELTGAEIGRLTDLCAKARSGPA